MTTADYERAIARLPNWMAVLGVIGTGLAARYAGLSGAAGFLLGSVAAWLNLRMIERGVNRIVRLTALQEPGTVSTGSRRSAVRAICDIRHIGLCYTQVYRFQSDGGAARVPGVPGGRDRRNRIRTFYLWSLVKPWLTKLFNEYLAGPGNAHAGAVPSDGGESGKSRGRISS